MQQEDVQGQKLVKILHLQKDMLPVKEVQLIGKRLLLKEVLL